VSNGYLIVEGLSDIRYSAKGIRYPLLS